MLKRLFNRKPKAYQVHLDPFGVSLTVGPRETILKAALKAGLAYPHECEVGACTSCKSLLVEGDIKALTDFAYVLESDELQNGYFLACQSLARSDLKVRVTSLEAGIKLISPRSFEGMVLSITRLTRDILNVCIVLNEPMDYCAGQYANLHVPGIVGPRAYSYANAPTQGGTTELSFHVRLLPDGAMSGWFADRAAVGASIRVDGPYGVFRLRESGAPMLCVAGGSGMAPIKAMLEQACQSGVPRPVFYLFGARTQADLYDSAVVEELLNAWLGPIHFLPVLSEEPATSDWKGARGLVTDFITAVDGFEPLGAQAYLCGPPAMVDTALPILLKSGVRGRDIYFDKFTDRSSSVSSEKVC